MSRRASTSCALVLLLAGFVPAMAGVTTTSHTNSYSVPGTTAKAVMRYMQSNPIRGDHGAAFASIHPSYALSIDSKQSGAMCRATRVDVRISFALTLPEATGRAQMSKRVRSAWDAFAAFARGHEEHHRQSYIGCAKSFVAAAQQKRGPSCVALEGDIRRAFESSKRDCEAKQVAWDRGQKGVLRRQSLVRMAGY